MVRAFLNIRVMAQPLAERLRPTSFDSYVGQQLLVGDCAVVVRMIDSG